jgi:hypothetical protein
MTTMKRRAGWWAVGAFAVVVAVILFVPIALPSPEPEPDLSLRVTAQDAFARHRQFGTEIVYTYGPWGLLQRPGSDARTESVTFSALLMLAVLFAAALLRVVRDAGASPLVAALVIAAAGSLVASGAEDARFVTIAFLLLFSALLPPGVGRELLLVAMCAFIALIKLSYLVLAVFAVVVLIAVRRHVWPALVFAGTFLLTWLAAGQHPGAIPLFLWRGAGVVSGYAAAVGRPSASSTELMSAVAGAIGLVIVAAAVERSVVRTGAIAGAAWLTLKIGYVRYDDSHAPAAGALLLFLGLGYLLLRVRGRAIAVVAGLGLAVVLVADGPLLLDLARSDWRWSRDRDAKVERNRALVARLANTAAVPFGIHGRIDAYPQGSAGLILRGLDYSPRPVFQSYMAWSETLAEVNASHLRGPGAPDWLWVSIGALDENPPLLEDAPSWLEIFSRYEVDRVADHHLLLRRRVSAIPFARTDLPSLHGRFGEKLPLPDAGGDLLWCAIDLQQPLSTRLVSAATRPPQLTMEILGSHYVLPVAMAEGGFILSPAVGTTEGLMSLAVDRRATHPVAWVRIGTQGLLSNPFGDSFILRVQRIRFSRSRG